MDILPILKQNAFLTLLIKDNFIFANLAYSDLAAERTYILSESTDLSPLKFRLDDSTFTKGFWFEYFNSLERMFDWDIVNRDFEGSFRIKKFVKEEVGVSGIKVLIDDNQPFFKNIFTSLKEFSNDIALKVLDDKYMEVISRGVMERLGYNDVIWIDLDISHFSIYRTQLIQTQAGIFSKEIEREIKFSSSKIDWNNEIGLIDFVKSSKLQAFLAVDSSSEDISNKWANFVAHNSEYISDPVLHDILRAFTTLQLLSLKQSNREKLDGIVGENCGIFVSGNIGKLLKRRELLISLLDGLELEGNIDLYIDEENKVLSFGKSMMEKEISQDIVVFKGDILPKVFKVLIPDIPSRSKNKIIFSGKYLAQNTESKDIFALGSILQFMKLPELEEKVIIEGVLKNGAVFSHFNSSGVQFMSDKKGVLYEYLVVDGRSRPIIYGPSVQNNMIKLKIWGDGDKE